MTQPTNFTMTEEVQMSKEDTVDWNWKELQPVSRKEFTKQLSELHKKIEELERRLNKQEEYQQEQNESL
jgi:hypothetical protein